jgi:hypothetical protein
MAISPMTASRIGQGHASAIVLSLTVGAQHPSSGRSYEGRADGRGRSRCAAGGDASVDSEATDEASIPVPVSMAGDSRMHP